MKFKAPWKISNPTFPKNWKFLILGEIFKVLRNLRLNSSSKNKPDIFRAMNQKH